MAIKLGNDKIKIMSSDNKVKRVYAGNVKIYSSGNVVTYKVDANISYTEEVDSDASCLSPKTFNPTKSGWEFLGWREDATANGTVLSSKIMADSPVTLYAVFRQTIKVIYYNNSTSPSGTLGYRYYNNGAVVNPSFTLTQASRSGWTARGWSTGTAGNSSITYNNGAEFTRDSNITLYGMYQQNITVTYYNNSTTASTTSGTRYYNSNGAVVNPSFTLTQAAGDGGGTARGWSTTNKGDATITYNNGATFTRDSNVTLYGLYQKTITLTTVANGVTSTKNGTRYWAPAGYINPTFTVSNPSKSGATFQGWSSSASSTTVTNSTISGLSLSASTTRYAVFKYADASMITYFTIIDWKLTEGGQPRTEEVIVTDVKSIDTNKYSALSIKTVSAHPEVNWRGCRTSMYYRVGSNVSECFAWYDSGWMDNPTNSNYGSDVTTNMSISPDQGVIPLYLRITISIGDSGAGRGRGYINDTGQGSIALTGRTVVG